ncbi:unnamed protein product [Owenia fusiformis]|uniref:Uncharacterized protein n=1 Tax=Owenia fusiformis TaxID=6347 RepID=A0A8J1U922_OWEFU|nr:unnamed protein product [Owenia fusiformis]
MKRWKTVTAPKNSDTINIFLGGNVMIGRGIDQIFPESSDPYIFEKNTQDARDYVKLAIKKNGKFYLEHEKQAIEYIWGYAMKTWEKYKPDVKLINLETTLTTSDTMWPMRPTQLRAHPTNVKSLKIAGIDCCGIANDHALDYGYQGLDETVKVLKEAGIKYTGAGRCTTEAKEPCIFDIADKGRVIIFSLCTHSSGVPNYWAATTSGTTGFGVNTINIDINTTDFINLKTQIKEVKKPRDVIILSLHWGEEWNAQIHQSLREFAHRAIDEAEVDAIHGHSTHFPLGIEVYREKLILYGTGDLINDTEGMPGKYEDSQCDLGFMYFAKVNLDTGNLIELRLVPFRIKQFRLCTPNPRDVNLAVNPLRRRCKEFDTDVIPAMDGHGFWLAFK